MSTAVQLVNRVRRKHRFGDVSSFSADDEFTAPILDTLNDAIETVLEERTWKFQTRRDGIFRTFPKTAVVFVSDSGSGTVVVSAANGFSAPYTDRSLRVWFQDESEYSLTSFRVNSIAVSGANWSLATDATHTYAITGTGNGIVFGFEYQLPTTVKKILSVRHQERPLSLYFEDEQLEFDQYFPRPEEHIEDEPVVAMIGGVVSDVTSSTATANTFSPSIKLWPVPDTNEQFIDYSYVYRQARLVATTDEMVGVPEVLQSKILDLCYARTLQTGVANQVTEGLRLEGKVLADIARFHKDHKPDALERRPVASLDRVSRARRRDPNLPRIVESL